MDDALLPRGVVNFVVEGTLGELQEAASSNLRCGEEATAGGAAAGGSW